MSEEGAHQPFETPVQYQQVPQADLYNPLNFQPVGGEDPYTLTLVGGMAVLWSAAKAFDLTRTNYQPEVLEYYEGYDPQQPAPCSAFPTTFQGNAHEFRTALVNTFTYELLRVPLPFAVPPVHSSSWDAPAAAQPQPYLHAAMQAPAQQPAELPPRRAAPISHSLPASRGGRNGGTARNGGGREADPAGRGGRGPKRAAASLEKGAAKQPAVAAKDAASAPAPGTQDRTAQSARDKAAHEAAKAKEKAAQEANKARDAQALAWQMLQEKEDRSAAVLKLQLEIEQQKQKVRQAEAAAASSKSDADQQPVVDTPAAAAES